jgi:hypothetical protein
VSFFALLVHTREDYKVRFRGLLFPILYETLKLESERRRRRRRSAKL